MSNLYRAWSNNKRVTDKEAREILEYIKKNKASMINIDAYVFDMNSLLNPIMLSECIRCERYQLVNCCNGNSYSTTSQQVNNINKYALDIIKYTKDSIKKVESYNKYGCFTANNSTTTRGSNDGECIFLSRNGEEDICSIHKWCNDTNRDYVLFKPYPCSLFPLEGVVFPNGKTFIFCCCKDTSSFSMYFYTSANRICVNKSNLIDIIVGKRNNKLVSNTNRDNIIADNIIDKYRPAYIEQEKVLRGLCGDKVYEELLLKFQ